jgi:hypothetical protein
VCRFVSHRFDNNGIEHLIRQQIQQARTWTQRKEKIRRLLKKMARRLKPKRPQQVLNSLGEYIHSKLAGMIRAVIHFSYPTSSINQRRLADQIDKLQNPPKSIVHLNLGCIRIPVEQ